MATYSHLSKIILFIVFLSAGLYSQSSGIKNFGSLRGIVSTENGEKLVGANVLIVETGFGEITNRNGIFNFDKIYTGNYTLRISYLGFKTVEKKIRIVKNSKTSIKVNLISTSFMIGNITVTAKSEYIPLDPIGKTVITSGEIDHLQASSISDLMSLIPGETKTNANLNSALSAKIRGGESIGTQIVFDDVPVSNNVNMQQGIGFSTMNLGIDLRSIPAANIKTVEVISGIPSVKYGDLADGLMLVTTKTKSAKTNLKVKYNPNITEFNFGTGFSFSNWIVNTNLNVASSGRDVRIEDDGYTRFSLQTNISKEFENSRIKNSIQITRTLDEKKEQPGYALKESWYNRDLNIRFNSNYSYEYSDNLKFNSILSLNYTKRDSYKQSLISRDNIVVSDRTENGTRQGIIVFGSYLGKKWIKGDEYNIYADLNLNKKFYTGSVFHKLLFGASYRNEFNIGKGIIFDPLYPPSLSTVSPRIRNYEDLPSVDQLSLYLEDKIVGKMILPFTFVAGIRMETYNPEFFKNGTFIDSPNGVYFNPRFNLSLKINKTTQLRAGYGVTTKAPPLGMIAAQNKYFDVVDTVAVNNPSVPAENLAIISTYIKQVANPELKAYKQKKMELSFDKDFKIGGITLTYFRNETTDGFSTIGNPFLLPKYSFPDVNDFSNKILKDKILTSFYLYENNTRTEVDGFEFKLSTNRIPYINTVVRIDGAYRHSVFSRDNKTELGSYRTDKELGGKVIPYYSKADTYKKSFKMNYRFDIQSKAIGMWFTIHIEHFLYNKNGFVSGKDKYALGYFNENGKYFDIEKNVRNSEKYAKLRRSISEYELRHEDLPSTFAVNLVVSKSLWKGSAISFFVNNFFDHRPYHRLKKSSDSNPSYVKRNNPIFYGMEFSTEL